MTRGGRRLECGLHASALAAAVLPAAARSRRRRSPQPPVQFLSRVPTSTWTASISAATTTRFIWDANFGGELDLVDYTRGRADLRRELPGHPRRRVRAVRPEPGQLHARRDGCRHASRALELAGVFHHESRHLGDRAKTRRLEHARRRGSRVPALGAARSAARADLRWTVKSRSSTTAGSSTRRSRPTALRPAWGVLAAWVRGSSALTARPAGAARPDSGGGRVRFEGERRRRRTVRRRRTPDRPVSRWSSAP